MKIISNQPGGEDNSELVMKTGEGAHEIADKITEFLEGMRVNIINNIDGYEGIKDPQTVLALLSQLFPKDGGTENYPLIP